MQIDSATLRDLEVFSASDGTGGIFDLIDHTRTNRGRRSVISGYESHDTPVVIAKILSELQEIVDLLSRGGSGGLLRRDRLYRHTIPKDVLRALELVGELDALTSMGRAAADLDWVFPKFINSNGFVFDAQGIFHPFVPGAVPNPVQLSHDTPMLFLTGPNMAGKTTYLRAAALVMLLGQTGLPVPAKSARLSPVEEIFTGFSVADNLKGGVSLFLAEVHRVKEAATLLAEGRSAFILFDEVFKGTNVKDALDASAEVMMGFAQAPRCGFIFSSHISELEDALKQTARIKFAYFDGQIESGDPTYNYQLRQGVSDQRFGLLLLHEAKIPELIARIGETGRPNE